ncbi:CUB and sushi domain-containing protein 3-like, partial [Mercenaria mercenaria]|uniref:CUB and sushi domain-containing protein 3-like n=1 Tax=Mercenaria mercenaria TaxID=6596 RepID=UPI00234F7656
MATGTWNCGNLSTPSNGNIELLNGTTYQSVAKFKCNTGYTLYGDSDTTCTASGSWSGNFLNCTINECGNLSNPSNGKVELLNGTTYQSVAKYKCNTGYILYGESDTTCTASGSWSGNFLNCTINDCGNLSNPSNGKVDLLNGTTYQSVAKYKCNTGYTLYGDSDTTCTASGSWSGNFLNCTINDCGNLSNPSNGKVDLLNGTTYQSVAKYKCNTGYTLYGDSDTTCTASGSWSGNFLNCTINDCGNLSNPLNGKVDLLNGTTYQAVAKYKCNTGYTLYGDSDAICTASGTWSGHFLNCTINDCGNLSNPSNGKIDLLNDTTYQSVAKYKCNTGYTLYGDSDTTCTASGTWSGKFLNCTLNDCGNLSNPLNGKVDLLNGTTYQAVAKYKCNTGYTLYGDSDAICTASGTWSGHFLNCTINDCGNLPNPSNGIVDLLNGTAYQSVAKYKCSTGYTLYGDSDTTCTASGTWSGNFLNCTINDCGNLSNPLNGKVDLLNGTTYQAVAKYKCNTGYTLYDDSDTICTASGTWSGHFLNCTINDCGNLPNPSNGIVDLLNGTAYQSVAKYKCSTGYTLYGDSDTTCTASGTWSGNFLNCTINDCGNLSNPSNGKVDLLNGTTYQSVAKYKCNTGYTLYGDSDTTCTASGTWSGNYLNCTIN